MNLKIEVEKVDDVRRRIAVEVPAEAVRSELERAYGELSRSVNVPGFRRGRVPRPVLERMFSDRVRAQVFERLMRESFVEAVQDEKLPVVGQPEFETESAQPGEPLRYHAMVEVKPEVTARDYRGIAAERPLHEVNDTEVDAVLERMRESHARLHPLTDRDAVQNGDVVGLAYEARSEGKTVGRADHRDVEIGRNGFPPAFDAALLGARVGSTLRFDLEYPADHPSPEVAGKSIEFEVSVKGLASKELPALDDDFAKTHGDTDSLEELRRNVRGSLEHEAQRNADEAVRRQLLGKVLEAHEVQVPQALLARRLEGMVDEVWEDWRQHRTLPRNEASAKQKLRVELEPRARDQVKLSLLLDAIARQEDLQVSDSDVDARIASITEDAGAAGERVRAFYSDPHAREQLRAGMLNSRAIDVVVNGAQIRDVKAESQIADTAENR